MVNEPLFQTECIPFMGTVITATFAQRFQASLSFRCQNIAWNICASIRMKIDTFSQKEPTSTLTVIVNRMFFTYTEGVSKWNLFWRKIIVRT